MKRKILSLILVLMLLPIATIFTACKKEKENDLTALKTEFYNIASENNNIKHEGNKLVFDYSAHASLKDIISNTEPYQELEKYDIVFENLMSFSFNYVEKCSIQSKVITKGLKADVENNLKDLKKTINDVNKNINIFAEEIVVSSNKHSNTCKERYKNLLVAYEDMFQSATNFNSSLGNLYFNHLLNNSNPDVFSAGSENFDANIVVSKIRARVTYQISCLSQCFVEMYVDGGNLANEIAFNNAEFNLDEDEYATKVENIKLNENFDEAVAAEMANHEDNKANFYDYSVQAQKMQSTINNDRSKFIIACNSIEFSNSKKDINATPYEKICVEIIESNNYLTSLYNNVLKEMVKIINNSGAKSL